MNRLTTILIFTLFAVPCYANEALIFEALFDEGGSPFGFDSLTESGVGNELRADAVAAHSIKRGARVVIGGNAGGAFLDIGSLPASDYLHTRTYMRFTNAFASAGATNLIVMDDGGTTRMRIYSNAVGTGLRAQVREAGASIFNDDIDTLVLDHWYKVDTFQYFVALAAGGEAFIYLDDTLAMSIPGEFAGESPDLYRLGGLGLDNGDVGAIYFDDVVIDTTRQSPTSISRPVIPSVIADVNTTTMGSGWQW